MLAVRRADVTDLNDTIRIRLLEAGRLGPDTLTVDHGTKTREYRTGDRVIVTGNDHRLGLLNGNRADVTSVHPDARTLTLRTDEQHQVTVSASWAGRHLDHGYAMTCHKAQGATVDVALIYGTALTREAGYVALSRGRTANHLYVATQPEDLATDLGQEQHLDRVAARLATRRRHTLATRQLPRIQADLRPSSRTPERTSIRPEGISR
jgi:ATP-dependent exoDNAse (exonuclease V) alpha subunit